MSRKAASAFEPAPGIPEQVATYIQDRIVRGDLAPGERIAEARITDALGVSRGSVREALRLLSARHLVDFEPRRGARVAPFGPDDVNGLYDIQIALLSLLVRQVAQRWSEDDLPRFLAMGERIDEAARLDQPLDLMARSHEFLMTAAELVGNPFLSDTLERLIPVFSRAHFRVLERGPGERLGLAAFVAEVLKIAIDRDFAAVDDVVRRYGEHQRTVVLATFDDP